MNYVVQFNGEQYSPSGRIESPVDVESHNAALDAAVVEAMKHGERVVLYLTEVSHSTIPYTSRYEVSTWAGNWRKCAIVRTSWHNMAGRNGRRDVWFKGPDGARWYGVNIGDSQILRCRRLKNQSK